MIRFCHRVISQRSTLYTRTVESDRLPNVDKVMETNGHVYTPNMVLATKELETGKEAGKKAGLAWRTRWQPETIVTQLFCRSTSGACRELAQSLLRARWELVGSLLRAHWEPVCSLFRAGWKLVGSLLGACWKLIESLLGALGCILGAAPWELVRSWCRWGAGQELLGS